MLLLISRKVSLKSASKRYINNIHTAGGEKLTSSMTFVIICLKKIKIKIPQKIFQNKKYHWMSARFGQY